MQTELPCKSYNFVICSLLYINCLILAPMLHLLSVSFVSSALTALLFIKLLLLAVILSCSRSSLCCSFYEYSLSCSFPSTHAPAFCLALSALQHIPFYVASLSPCPEFLARYSECMCFLSSLFCSLLASPARCLAQV